MKDIKIAATQFEQLQNGCSLIIDTFGGIIAECQTQGDNITIASINPEKIEAGGT